MNMSYCRFENTLQDLRDCFNHIGDNDLSEDEKNARERMIKLCQKIVNSQNDDDDDDSDD